MAAAFVLLAGVQQKAGKGVVVAVVVAQVAVFGQRHVHVVPGGQVQSHHAGGAVLLVLCVRVFEDGDRHSVHLQCGARRQFGSFGARVAVHGQGEAVHAGERSGEDAIFGVVVATHVEEDMLVDNGLVVAVGPQAPAFVSQSHREGAAAGWGAGWAREQVRSFSFTTEEETYMQEWHM